MLKYSEGQRFKMRHIKVDIKKRNNEQPPLKVVKQKKKEVRLRYASENTASLNNKSIIIYKHDYHMFDSSLTFMAM